MGRRSIKKASWGGLSGDGKLMIRNVWGWVGGGGRGGVSGFWEGPLIRRPSTLSGLMKRRSDGRRESAVISVYAAQFTTTPRLIMVGGGERGYRDRRVHVAWPPQTL